MTAPLSAKRLPSAASVVIAALAAASPAWAGLTFTNTFDDTSATINAQQQQAIAYAEAGFSSLITNNLNVRMNFITQTPTDFGYTPGSLQTAYAATSYQQNFFPAYRSALAAAATSAIDAKAVGTLNASTVTVTDAYTPLSGNASNAGYAIRVNYPTDGATPRTLNSAVVGYTTANQRSLGLAAVPSNYGQYQLPSGADGDSYLLANPGSVLPYYYGPLNTPTPAGTRSYTRLIADQIATTLGLQSGVDTLDYDATPTTTVLHDHPTTATDDSVELELFAADLFRYRSINGVATRDGEIGDAYTYLSPDGSTVIGQLGTGVYYGNGDGAGQWVSGQNLGLFESVGQLGETARFTTADAEALDLLGYTVNYAAVPEPASLGLAVVAGGGLLVGRRRA